MPDTDTLFGLVSIPAIMALPWYVGIPGMLLAAVLALSALRSFFSFRILKSLTSLVMAASVLIILSQAGSAIVRLIDPESPALEGPQDAGTPKPSG